MSEQSTPEPDRPLDEQPAGQAPPPDAATPPPLMAPPGWRPPRVPLRDRIFRLRSLLAVGAAGLVLGAAGGAGGMALANHGGDGPNGHLRPLRLGPAQGQDWGPGSNSAQLPALPGDAAGGLDGQRGGQQGSGTNS